VLLGKSLRSLLNSGYRRDGARVLRSDGTFDVYCPKIVAQVGELPASLGDRAVVIGLKRKRPNETVASLDKAAIARLNALAAHAATWSSQQFDRLAAADPVLPNGLTDRCADSWGTLVAIADAAGGRWPELARSLALRAAAARTEESASILLLADLRAILRGLRTDRLATSEIVEWLAEREDRPWANYHRGQRPFTANDVAKLLRPFNIGPKTVRFGDTTAKGYILDDLQDAFDRYLPPES
jgi:hypothetical protein